MKRCKIVKEETSEEHLQIDGEFLTIDDMIDAKFPKLLTQLTGRMQSITHPSFSIGLGPDVRASFATPQPGRG